MGRPQPGRARGVSSGAVGMGRGWGCAGRGGGSGAVHVPCGCPRPPVLSPGSPRGSCASPAGSGLRSPVAEPPGPGPGPCPWGPQLPVGSSAPGVVFLAALCARHFVPSVIY